MYMNRISDLVHDKRTETKSNQINYFSYPSLNYFSYNEINNKNKCDDI